MSFVPRKMPENICGKTVNPKPTLITEITSANLTHFLCLTLVSSSLLAIPIFCWFTAMHTHICSATRRVVVHWCLDDARFGWRLMNLPGAGESHGFQATPPATVLWRKFEFCLRFYGFVVLWSFCFVHLYFCGVVVLWLCNRQSSGRKWIS